MKRNLTLLFVFFATLSFSQKIVTKAFWSNELRDVREILIQLPKNYNKTNSNFVLTFVVGSQQLFNSYAISSNRHTALDNAPEQIIVGIETKRKDVFSEKTEEGISVDNTLFYLFLRDELLPFIEGNYRVSPFVSIVGLEGAANLMTYFLGEETPLFNAFICLNPNLLEETITKIDSYKLERYKKLDNTFYFYLSSSPNNSENKQQKITRLNTSLHSLAIPNFNVVFDEASLLTTFESSIDNQISRGIKNIFQAYAKISEREFDSAIKDLSPVEAIVYLENKYIELNYLFGIDKKIREQDIIAIEDIVIHKEEGAYLNSFGSFLLNVKPDSPLGDYYIGKYYETVNKPDASLTYYKAAQKKVKAAKDSFSYKLYKDNVLRAVAQF